MSNTFFVHLPSNSPEYGDNAPNKFRVRLPKPIYFNGSWVCGLHSINYAYSWPSTVGTLDDQWINVHYIDSADGGRTKYISIPVSKASHTSVENFREFLKATLAVQAATIEEVGKSNYQFIAAERDGSPPRRTKRALDETVKSPPLADGVLSSPPRAESSPPPAKKAVPSPPSSHPSPPPPAKKTEPKPPPPPAKKTEPNPSPPQKPSKKPEPKPPPPPLPPPATPRSPPKASDIAPHPLPSKPAAKVEKKQVVEKKAAENPASPPKVRNEKSYGSKVPADKKISIILGEENKELRSSTSLTLMRELVNSIELQYHPEFARFKAVFKHPSVSFLSFSPQLGYVLGFENPEYVRNSEIAKYGCDLRGGFSSFAVYTGNGLTENMIIGNSLSSLLRVVSVSGVKPGEYTERIFDSPIFVRVLPKEVSEIEIELRTLDQGRLVPFAFGTVMVVLVFKKVINF